MQEHDWEVETLDGGPMGDCDFWKCNICGASGGPTIGIRRADRGKRWPPFYPGHGLKLSDDCDVAKSQVSSYLASEEYGKRVFDWQFGDARRALGVLEKSHGVGGAIDRKTGRVNGRKGHKKFAAEPKAPGDWLRVTLVRRGAKEVLEVGQYQLTEMLTRFFDEPDV